LQEYGRGIGGQEVASGFGGEGKKKAKISKDGEIQMSEEELAM